MENLKTMFLFVFLLAVVSCSEDENADKITEGGTLLIEGVNYEMVHGEISVTGEINPPGDVYGQLLYFLSSGYQFTENEVSGTGQTVQLHFWTLTDEYIAAGEYSIFDENNSNVNTFIIDFYTSMDQDSWEIEYYFKAISGTISVERKSSFYTITANVLTEKYNLEYFGVEPETDPIADNINIIFNYTGELKQKYFE